MRPLIHHVSVINSDMKKSFEFYKHILGMKLVIKTVNQDDREMYHLFVGNAKGSAGSEFTVFEMSGIPNRKFGNNSIDRTIFKVNTEESLDYWQKRLEDFDICHYGIEEYNNKKLLRFEDYDGTPLGLTIKNKDELAHNFHPNKTADIPIEHSILAIDSVHLRIPFPKASQKILKDLLKWKTCSKMIGFNKAETIILSNESTDLYQEVHLIHDNSAVPETMGIGGTHHVAFSAESYGTLMGYEEWLINYNMMSSGIKDREIFKSLYFREANRILFEIATEEMNHDILENDFADVDEYPLYLPAFLEKDREKIEYNLK